VVACSAGEAAAQAASTQGGGGDIMVRKTARHRRGVPGGGITRFPQISPKERVPFTGWPVSSRSLACRPAKRFTKESKKMKKCCSMRA